jgi:hypothetical protein
MSFECISLSGDPEQRSDKLCLPYRVYSVQHLNLVLPHHVRRFEPFYRSIFETLYKEGVN